MIKNGEELEFAASVDQFRVSEAGSGAVSYAESSRAQLEVDVPHIKKRYTLPEAMDYLRREGTPEISTLDLVTLCAEGHLTICFQYKGALGLFKNLGSERSTVCAPADGIFEKAVATHYFHGILRSVSRPSPNSEVESLRGAPRKVHCLRPVRVIPVSTFASDPKVEVGEPEGFHWRRVHEAGSPWAGITYLGDLPASEWLIEAEGLRRLTATQLTPSRITDTSFEPASSPARAGRIVSSKTRRDSLTPVIEQAQSDCRDPWDVAEVWPALLKLAEQRATPLIGVTDDGVKWMNQDKVKFLPRKALAERIRRMKPRQPTLNLGSAR